MRPLLERVLQGETVSIEQLLAQPAGERALGVGALRAEPRRRRQGHRHLRGAHRRPRPEAQRGRAAPRQLDAVVAHQQHAARGARVGPRFPARALVAAGRAASSAGAPTRCSGMPIDGNPLLHDADRERRGRSCSRRLMSGEEPRATGLTRNNRKDGETIWCEWYHSCLLDDRRQHRVDPVVRAGRVVADPGRGAPAVHGDARRADRAAQPAAAARAAGAGDRAGEAQRPPRRRAVHRPRPLQERQRHARPPDRRRAAEARERGAVGARCARPTCWRGSAATSSW